MRIGVSDIEGNNLYNRISKFHCAWIINPNDKTDQLGFRPNQFKEYIKSLQNDWDIIVFHNGVDFDGPAIHKLDNSFKGCRMFDTLVLSRMLFPERPTHSLKSWGIELGILKGEYGKSDEEDSESAWESFSEEMYEYCKQDVLVTIALYHHLCNVAGFDPTNPPSVSLDFSSFEYKRNF